MFCAKCGTKLPDGAVFCTRCGNRIGDSAPDKRVQASVRPEIERLEAGTDKGNGRVNGTGKKSVPAGLFIVVAVIAVASVISLVLVLAGKSGIKTNKNVVDEELDQDSVIDTETAVGEIDTETTVGETDTQTVRSDQKFFYVKDGYIYFLPKLTGDSTEEDAIRIVPIEPVDKDYYWAECTEDGRYFFYVSDFDGSYVDNTLTGSLYRIDVQRLCDTGYKDVEDCCTLIEADIQMFRLERYAGGENYSVICRDNVFNFNGNIEELSPKVLEGGSIIFSKDDKDFLYTEDELIEMCDYGNKEGEYRRFICRTDFGYIIGSYLHAEGECFFVDDEGKATRFDCDQFEELPYPQIYCCKDDILVEGTFKEDKESCLCLYDKEEHTLLKKIFETGIDFEDFSESRAIFSVNKDDECFPLSDLIENENDFNADELENLEAYCDVLDLYEYSDGEVRLLAENVTHYVGIRLKGTVSGKGNMYGGYFDDFVSDLKQFSLKKGVLDHDSLVRAEDFDNYDTEEDAKERIDKTLEFIEDNCVTDTIVYVNKDDKCIVLSDMDGKNVAAYSGSWSAGENYLFCSNMRDFKKGDEENRVIPYNEISIILFDKDGKFKEVEQMDTLQWARISGDNLYYMSPYDMSVKQYLDKTWEGDTENMPEIALYRFRDNNKHLLKLGNVHMPIVAETADNRALLFNRREGMEEMMVISEDSEIQYEKEDCLVRNFSFLPGGNFVYQNQDNDIIYVEDKQEKKIIEASDFRISGEMYIRNTYCENVAIPGAEPYVITTGHGVTVAK